jgi:hypothetical protein
MNFSIVMPSLRWEWLEVVVDSVYETAKEPDKVEVIVAINTICDKSPIICERCKKKHPTFQYYTIDHTTMMKPNVNFVGIVPYVNYLTLRYSTGKYVMPFNDDALMVYKNWDVRSLWRLKTKDKVLGLTNDNIRPRGFNNKPVPACSFPLISRVGIDYFGFLFDPIFYHNTADTNICFRYYEKRWTVNLEDIVMIEHRPLRLCNWKFRYEAKYKDLVTILEEKSSSIPWKNQ